MARSKRHLEERKRERRLSAVTFAGPTKTAKVNFRTPSSFSGTQLLRLSRLAGKAYDRTAKLTKEARKDERKWRGMRSNRPPRVSEMAPARAGVIIRLRSTLFCNS